MSASQVVQKSSTSKWIYIRLYDSSTFTMKTGITYNSSGALCWFTPEGALPTIHTLGPLTNAGSAYSPGGFVEVSAASLPGLYRLDLWNNSFTSVSTQNQVELGITFTGVVPDYTNFALVNYDPAAAGPSTSSIADSVLNRNIAQGSDGGRNVSSALYALRNKVDATSSVGTVYQTDDATSGWTFSTSTGAWPFSKVDPA